jgi:hypothetical protein
MPRINPIIDLIALSPVPVGVQISPHTREFHAALRRIADVEDWLAERGRFEPSRPFRSRSGTTLAYETKVGTVVSLDRFAKALIAARNATAQSELVFVVCAEREAEAEWVQIVNGPNPMTKYQSVCTPGYYNGEGTSEGQGFLQAVYPKGALAFFNLLARWR